MKEAARCETNDVFCFAEDLLQRWELRDAERAAIAETAGPEPEVECLPCLLHDWDSDAVQEPAQ